MDNANETSLVDLLKQISDEYAQLLQGANGINQTFRAHHIEQQPELQQALGMLLHKLEQAAQQGRSLATRLDRLQEVVRRSALITSTLELNQVLENLMDTVIELTGAERAYLLLTEPDNDELVIRAARNWQHETVTDAEQTSSRSIVTAALEQGQPILTTDAQSDPRFQRAKSVFKQGLRSVLCIPLVLYGQTVGVLYADNRFARGMFSTEHLPLLAAFGTQAAIAIQNARTFERVRQELELSKRQLEAIHIRIDHAQVEEDSRAITETEYFQHLERLINELQTDFDNS